MRLASLLVVLLFASGCLSREAFGPPLQPAGDPTLQPAVSSPAPAAPEANATPPPDQPQQNLDREPVHIHESGTMTDSLSRRWDWQVEPGFTKFTVELYISGPQDSAYVYTQAGYTLWSGEPRERVASRHGTLGFSATPQCLACHDGQGLEDPLGPWSLTFDSEPSLASYELRIVVSY